MGGGGGGGGVESKFSVQLRLKLNNFIPHPERKYCEGNFKSYFGQSLKVCFLDHLTFVQVKFVRTIFVLVTINHCYNVDQNLQVVFSQSVSLTQYVVLFVRPSACLPACSS